jgi:putative redox protein
MRFEGTGGSGHSFIIDASAEFGGQDAGIRPMEAVLASLGACSGMDVISILRKKKQDVTGYEINLHGERAEEHPRVYTSITVEHVIRGRGIDSNAVSRAVELSTDKYCSVLAMLNKVAKIAVTYRIEEEA